MKVSPLEILSRLHVDDVDDALECPFRFFSKVVRKSNRDRPDPRAWLERSARKAVSEGIENPDRLLPDDLEEIVRDCAAESLEGREDVVGALSEWWDWFRREHHESAPTGTIYGEPWDLEQPGGWAVGGTVPLGWSFNGVELAHFFELTPATDARRTLRLTNALRFAGANSIAGGARLVVHYLRRVRDGFGHQPVEVVATDEQVRAAIAATTALRNQLIASLYSRDFSWPFVPGDHCERCDVASRCSSMWGVGA